MAAGTSETPDRRAVRDFLESTQAGICAALEALDGEARFRGEEIARPGGGVSRPRVLAAMNSLRRRAGREPLEME